MTAWEASNELHLFPVKVREYRKPEDECNDELIKFFKTYPQKQSNFPEGVITSKPDLYKCDIFSNTWVIFNNTWVIFSNAWLRSAATHPVTRYRTIYYTCRIYKSPSRRV